MSGSGEEAPLPRGDVAGPAARGPEAGRRGFGDAPAEAPDVTGTPPPAPGPGDVRASDADRQAVVDRLTRATGEGLITLEELSVASGRVYDAVTRADLGRVVAGLHLPEPAAPPVATTSGVAPTVGVPEGSGAAVHRRRWTVAVMSESSRRGRWHVRRREGAFAWWGSSRIDLRGAAFEEGEVEIVAVAVMGSVSVLVPEGVPVETSGMMVMGGRTARIRDVPPIAGAPRVVVRGYGLWGSVSVVSRAPRAVRRARREEARRRREQERRGAPGPGLREDTDRGWEQERFEQRAERRARREEQREQLWAQRQARRAHGPEAPPSTAPPTFADPAEAVTGMVATVMCTDIVASTRLALDLGDQRWAAVLREHDRLVRHHVARFGGREVKTTGDGFLVTFASARAAVACATEVHAAMDGWSAGHPEAPLSVRIGVHAGEVERDGGDVVGRNVTLACRICDAAQPGEVLASTTVATLADSASDLVFGPAREVTLSGFPDPVPVRTASRR